MSPSENLAGRIRVAIAITTAGVLCVLVGATPARSDVAPPEDTVAIPWQESLTSPENYAPEDLAAMAADLGITAEQALVRVEVEEHASELERRARSLYPGTFAGLWITTSGPDPYVNLGFTQHADISAASLAPTFVYPELVVPNWVDYSLAHLVGVQDAMITERELGRSLQVGQNDPILDLQGQYDLDIDIEASRVVVSLMNDTAAARQAFYDKYGNIIAFREGFAIAEDCTRSDCRYKMKGGLGWQGASGINGCSTGFTATDGSTNFVLTAGHCGEHDIWNGGGTYAVKYGEFSKEYVFAMADVQRMKKTNPIWEERGRVWVEDTDQRAVKYIKLWNDVEKGTYILKSGWKTKTTRGYIKSKWHSPNYIPWGKQFITADYCSGPGDSGGAVMRSNTAYGIHSGRTKSGCDGSYGVFGSIEFATSLMDVTLISG